MAGDQPALGKAPTWAGHAGAQDTDPVRARVTSSRRRVAPRGADRRAAVGGPRRWWRVHLGARRSTVWIDQLHSGSMKPQRREMLPLARALAARFLAASQMGLRECPGRVKSYPSYGLPVAGLYAINGPGTATYDSKECPWGSWRCCDPSRHRIGAGIKSWRCCRTMRSASVASRQMTSRRISVRSRLLSQGQVARGRRS